MLHRSLVCRGILVLGVSLAVGAIVVPFISAALLALYALRRSGQAGAGLAVATGAFEVVVVGALLIGGVEPVHQSFPWVPELGLEVGILADGLSLLFAALIALISFLTLVYSVSYLPHDLAAHGFRRSPAAYYAGVLLFTGAMLGLVLAADLIQLYVFWELSGIASFLLIGYHWYERAAWTGAVRSLVVTSGAGIVMLVGLLTYGATAGTFAVPTPLATAAANSASTDLPEPFVSVIVALVIVGAAAKSAQFPLHGWLPGAMVAPTPVSAFLHSAALLAAGVYLLARLHPLFAWHPLWEVGLLVVGGLSILVGGFGALRQQDLKALLAFSTIGQYGYVFLILSIASADGLAAALNLFLGHGVLKSGLFLVVGAVTVITGARSFDRLGGLGRTAPVLGGIAGILAIGLSGIPPLLSFWTKEKALDVVPSTPIGTIALILLVVGSILTVVYALRFWVDVFHGEPSRQARQPRPVPDAMLATVAVLAVLTIVGSLWPNLVLEALVAPAIAAPVEPIALRVSTPLLLSLLAIALGAALFITRRAWLPAIARPTPPSAEVAYDRVVTAFQWVGRVAVSLQSGFLLHYLWLTFGGAIVFLVLVATATGGIVIPPATPFAVGEERAQGALIGLLILVCVSTVLTLALRRHLHAIFALAAAGYLLAGAFALLLAPDVALVQVHVETLATVYWVAILVLVPARFREPLALPWWRRLQPRTTLVAVSAGFAATIFSYRVIAYLPSETVATFYIQQGSALAGATDLVNAIIVEFRALDTLGEITVFATAAIGVLALARLLRGGVA